MTLAVAFLGGLVSCLSPCVLPVLPIFTGYVGGSGGSAVLHGASVAQNRRLRAAGFLLGFAGVFVVLWVSLGLVGYALLSAIPGLRPAAGLVIVALGVATALGWELPLGGVRFGAGRSFGGAFLLGSGVAIGWTPCIGPTLGAILTMAAASDSVGAGAALLLAYAAGMAFAFVVVAVAASRVRPLSRFLGRHRQAFRAVTGALIVVVGLLVATNGFSRLAGLVPWVF